MDLNYVMIWMVATSAGLGFVLIALRHRLQQPGWLFVHAATALLLGVLYLLRRDDAGIWAALVWAPTAVAPLLSLRVAAWFAVRQRYRWAHRFARLGAWLHPFDGWLSQASMLRALAWAEGGDRERARAELERLGRGTSVGAWIARLQLLHLEGAWMELVRAVEQQKGGAPVPREPTAAAMYVRALGELNEVDAMLRAFRAIARSPGLGADATLTLVAAAFVGNPDWVRRINEGILAARPEEFQRFWLGTAHVRAGSEAEAVRLLSPLAEGDNRLVRDRARRRLDEEVMAKPVDAALADVLLDLEQRVAGYATIRLGGAPVATVGFAVLNVLVFLRELPGGSTDPRNLYALGALFMDPTAPSVEPWRMVTAAMLHFGWLHLAMNVMALVLFGRRLEALIGSARMAGIYVATGAGSLGLTAFAAVYRDGAPALLVGASGSVMGLVGALTGVYVRRWLSSRTKIAGSVVWPMLAVIGLQVAFDLSTPQVSMSAHLAGVVVGAVLGALLSTGGERATRRPTPRRQAWAIAVALVVVAFGAFEWRARRTAAMGAPLPPLIACSEGEILGCERACEAGHLESCVRAGYARSQGEGIEMDEARAFGLYERACDGGQPIACSNLGLMLRYGHGTEVDLEKAVEVFDRACRAEHPRGCTLYAEMLEDGAGIAPDPGRAEALFARACADGDELACEEQE